VVFHRELGMAVGDSIRRWAGRACLFLVVALSSMGYHYGNVRFAPVALGFAILAALCWWDSGTEQVTSNGIHPRADSGVHRAIR
jgi:hypothetical protein